MTEAIYGLDQSRYGDIIKGIAAGGHSDIETFDDLSRRIINFDKVQQSMMGNKLPSLGSARAADFKPSTPSPPPVTDTNQSLSREELRFKENRSDREVSLFMGNYKCTWHLSNDHHWTKCPHVSRNWTLDKVEKRIRNPRSATPPPTRSGTSAEKRTVRFDKASAVTHVTTEVPSPMTPMVVSSTIPVMDVEDASIDSKEFCLDFAEVHMGGSDTVVVSNDTSDHVSFYSLTLDDCQTCIGSASHTSSSDQVLPTAMMIVDSGATRHMIPDQSAFVSYIPSEGAAVTLADKSRVSCRGHGRAVISLDGHIIMLSDCLHVPDLRAPLYSVRQHRRLPGCAFIADHRQCLLTFPSFFVTIDDSDDCVIPYRLIGTTSTAIEFRDITAKACAVTTRSQTRKVLPPTDECITTLLTPPPVG
ncbi:MAG: hypothetical protein ACRDL7_07830, partial [Gaiellaceae bacterium]